jgi:hypothetical protein
MSAMGRRSVRDFTGKCEAMADAAGWNLQMTHYRDVLCGLTKADGTVIKRRTI